MTVSFCTIPIVCYFEPDENGKAVLVRSEYAEVSAGAIAATLLPIYRAEMEQSHGKQGK